MNIETAICNLMATCLTHVGRMGCGVGEAKVLG